jgi:hypothetical protein
MSENIGEQSLGSSSDKFDGSGNYLAWKRKWKVNLLTESELTTAGKAMKLFRAVVGNASILLMADVPDDPETFPFNTPAEIFRILDAQYASSSGTTKADALAQIMGLRQGKRTVEEYTMDFESLAPLAGITGDAKIACYLRGMTREINTTIGVMAPPDWPAAVRAARRAAELNQGRNPPKTFGNSRRGRGGRPQQPGRQAQEEPRLCFECDSPDHIARDCPQRQRGGSRGGRGRRGRGGGAPGRRVQHTPETEDEPEWELELAGNE